MNEEDRLEILVEHRKFDWGKINGTRLPEAAEYLTQLAKSLPKDAYIEEHWTGYEDMEIRVVSFRPETDEEYRGRKKQEEWQREYEEKEQARKAERDRRREEYLRLKKEFG